MNTSELKNVFVNFSKRVMFLRECLDYFYRKQKADNEINKFKLDNLSLWFLRNVLFLEFKVQRINRTSLKII